MVRAGLSLEDEALIGLPPAAENVEGLTVREARFVYYVVHGNKSSGDAALLSGYAWHTGRAIARRPHVQRAIREELMDFRDSVKATLQQVISEYAKIAFLDPKALFDAKGNPKPIHELDDLTASAIAGLEVTTDDIGGNIITKTTKYKLSDKRAALSDLLKVLGVAEKVELKGDVRHSLEVAFVKAKEEQ